MFRACAAIAISELMANCATFLHLTDAHVSSAGVPFARDDQKVEIPGVPAGKREAVLGQLFARVAERLKGEGRQLDGVIFSGDAQSRGDPGGHELVFKLLIDHLGAVGVTPGRIVATPGNHDVPRDAPPSSAERYANFCKVWRDPAVSFPGWMVSTHGLSSQERWAGTGLWPKITTGQSSRSTPAIGRT
jgi:3',5'-cyclic AMP phosphodiesterase CpdA